MTRALSVNNKDSKILVEFRYGDPDSPTYARFTSWTQDVTVDANVYTSLTTLEVLLGSSTGTLEDKSTLIKLPLVADGLADKASSGVAHSPIYVTVRELTTDPTGVGSSDDLTLFKGKVAVTRRNYQGKPEVVAFECVSVKSSLKAPLGVTCDNQCRWTLGDISCKVDIDALADTSEVASITKRTLTIATPPAWSDATYYRKGYLEIDGLRIGIRDWSSGSPTVFELVAVPPQGWIGLTARIVPGCDKAIETCRGRFSNESNFGGMGYAMPAWHPSIEGP